MNLHLTDPVRFALKAAVFAGLVGCLLLVSQSSLAAQHDLIPTAIAIDLLLTVPFVYFLLIRNTSIPRITVVPVFFSSFFIGSAVLPNGMGALGVIGTFVVSAVELGALSYLGLRIFRTRKAYAAEKEAGLDLMENLRKVLARDIKPAALARAAAFEMGVLGYLLFVWRRPQIVGFTYHRRNSPGLVLTTFLFLLLIETVALHLLLALWSPTIAWVSTALSLYVGMQLISHLKAIRCRPIVVTDRSVMIRCGILGDVSVPRSSIEQVSTIERAEPRGLDLLPLGAMSQPNIQIKLSEPAVVYGIYGVPNQAAIIRISVDEPFEFIRVVNC